MRHEVSLIKPLGEKNGNSNEKQSSKLDSTRPNCKYFYRCNCGRNRQVVYSR